MAWADDLPPIHLVEVSCRCPDIENCATLDLVHDRDRGWKEALSMRELLTLGALASAEAPHAA